MKVLIKYSFFFALLLLCGYALADNGTGLPSSLNPSSNDQSRYYLGVIFGNVGSVLSSAHSTILGTMFGEFNRAVLILGTIIFTYVYGKGVLDTAAHGEFLGKQASSLWVPIRSIGGLALMIPQASTGYCVIQVFLMWVVLQGVGAADMIWSSLASTFESSSSSSQQDASTVISAAIATQMVPQVQNIFSSLVCGYALLTNENSGNVLPVDFVQSGNNRSYNINYYPEPHEQPLTCGSVTWQDSCSASDAGCTKLVADQQIAIKNIITDLQPIASKYVSESYRLCNYRNPQGACIEPAYPQSLNDAGNNGIVAHEVYTSPPANSTNFPQTEAGHYVDTLAADKAGQRHDDPSKPQNDHTFDDGWIYAGSYIYQLASNVNQSGTIPNFTTSVASISDISSYFPKGYPNPIQLASSYTQSLPSNQQSGGGQSSGADQDQTKLLTVFAGMTAMTDVGLGVATATVGGSGLFFMLPFTIALGGIVTSFDVILSMIIAHNTNPLSAILYLQTFGFIVLSIVAIAFGLMLVGIFVTGLGENIANCMQPVGYATAETFSYISYGVFAAFGALVAIGLFLAVYLPLLPFIYFTFGVLSWLVAVFETMMAAPIVALGIIHPEGHDFWGKAEPAVMLTVNIFLRPSLMLFGLMASILIGYVFVDIITVGFAQALFNMQDHGAELSNPLEGISVMALYTFLIVVGYTQCFKLITETGNKVLSWIGFQGQLGSSSDEAIGQMKQHGSEIGGAAQSGFKDAEDKVRQKAGEENRRRNEGGGPDTGMTASGGDGLQTPPSSQPASSPAANPFPQNTPAGQHHRGGGH